MQNLNNIILYIITVTVESTLHAEIIHFVTSKTFKDLSIEGLAILVTTL